MSTQSIFDQLLISINLYQHLKYQAILLSVLEIWLIKKSYNLIGWEQLAHISGIQQIIYVFIIEQIQSKLMTKSFNKLKKPFLDHFWSISPNFWAKNIFPENPALSHTTSCENSEETNDTISRKRSDKTVNGRTHRPYFIRPFGLPPGIKNSDKDSNFYSTRL